MKASGLIMTSPQHFLWSGSPEAVNSIQPEGIASGIDARRQTLHLSRRKICSNNRDHLYVTGVEPGRRNAIDGPEFLLPRRTLIGSKRPERHPPLAVFHYLEATGGEVDIRPGRRDFAFWTHSVIGK